MTVAERREREKEERRSHILEAAARCFYASGFEQATMDDVAAAAQLGKGTLYLYFRNKEELIVGIVAHRQRALRDSYAEAERNAANGAELVRALLKAYVHQMTTPAEHLKLALSRWASGKALDPQARAAGELQRGVQLLFGTVVSAIERGQKDGTLHCRRSPKRLALHLWSCVNGAMLLRLQLECLPMAAELEAFAPDLDDAIDILIESMADRIKPLAAAGGS